MCDFVSSSNMRYELSTVTEKWREASAVFFLRSSRLLSMPHSISLFSSLHHFNPQYLPSLYFGCFASQKIHCSWRQIELFAFSIYPPLWSCSWLPLTLFLKGTISFSSNGTLDDVTCGGFKNYFLINIVLSKWCGTHGVESMHPDKSPADQGMQDSLRYEKKRYRVSRFLPWLLLWFLHMFCCFNELLFLFFEIKNELLILSVGRLLVS